MSVRIALGATPAGIGRLVLRQAAGICVPGLVLGLLGAAAVAAILRTQMVGLRLPGWALALVVPLVIALLGLVAAWLPARRAVRMEPLAALRADG